MTPRHEIVRYSTRSYTERSSLRALRAALARSGRGVDRPRGAARSGQESREFRALDRAGARALGCARHPLARAGAASGGVKHFPGRSSPRPLPDFRVPSEVRMLRPPARRRALFLPGVGSQNSEQPISDY